MMASRLVSLSVTLVTGFAIAAGLFWSLLGVPESNVLALALSAVLVVLIALTIGFTVALASAIARRLPVRSSLTQAVAALPSFLIGLGILVVLWWSAGRFDAWWQLHMGEVDAISLRYFGVTRTAPLHGLVFALTWFVRWGLAISIVLATTAAGVTHGIRGIKGGLRDALKPLRLGLTALAMLTLTQGLWRLAYWRPANLPATQIEVVFAAVKLGVLLALASLAGAFLVTVHRNGRKEIDQLVN